MKWSRTLSKPVGTVVGLFGLANIAGAVVSAASQRSADFILPGVVIGGAWAAFGFKRGLPIVPVSTGADTQQGLQAIRRRRTALILTVCATLPLAAVILPRVPSAVMNTAFLLVAMPAALAFVWWALSGCPRCGEHFFPIGKPRGRLSWSRCQHCGL